MKKTQQITLSIILLFCFSSSIYAQQLTTNELGQKIVVYSDGSWRYAEEADLIEFGETSSENPVTQVEAPKEDEDMNIAIKIAEQALAAEQEAIKRAENIQYKRILLEDELEEMEDSDDFFDDEITEIKNKLKSAKKAEKKARKQRKEASKKAREAEGLLTMSDEERAKALPGFDMYDRMKSEAVQLASEDTNAYPIENTDAIVEEETVNRRSAPAPEPESAPALIIRNNLKERPYAEFAKYDRDKDVQYNPPKRGCSLAFDGVDEFSGKKRKDVEKQMFFTYTNQELRSIFKERDYMECSGYLSALSGGLTFLTLNITINSKSAQREYGILEKGALINIKLLNGDNVKLVNSKTNMGIEDPLENSVSYRAQYLISSGDEKKLKKSEVDKVRIIWSSGYEDYEIYELDFFIDQFKCLDK